MATSQNGWSAITDSSKTRHWKIPLHDKNVILPMRPGAAGFVLACWALWFHRTVEPIGAKQDDWGWAYRNVRGSDTQVSNHSSGTAIDLNATQHGLGADPRNSYSHSEITLIHKQLAAWDDVIRWGGDYQSRKDGMHFEINKGSWAVNRLAKRLLKTDIGKDIARANKYPLSQKAR